MKTLIKAALVGLVIVSSSASAFTYCGDRCQRANAEQADRAAYNSQQNYDHSIDVAVANRVSNSEMVSQYGEAYQECVKNQITMPNQDLRCQDYRN